MTIWEWKQCAWKLLEKAGVENARFECDCMLEQCLQKNRQWLLLHKGEELAPKHLDQLDRWVQKRSGGYPLQYLLGNWEFYGRVFSVGEGVLIPRPDTECLCQLALEKMPAAARVADLCAGSGCIAVTLANQRRDSRVVAVELSDVALNYCRANNEAYGRLVSVVQGDVLSPQLASQFHSLDLIVSNPPYLTQADMERLQPEVTHEPAMALYGQRDGLFFYREITRLWKDALSNGGLLAYEIGIGQQKDVSAIMEGNGFETIGTRTDAAGIVRVVYGVKSN